MAAPPPGDGRDGSNVNIPSAIPFVPLSDEELEELLDLLVSCVAMDPFSNPFVPVPPGDFIPTIMESLSHLLPELPYESIRDVTRLMFDPGRHPTRERLNDLIVDAFDEVRFMPNQDRIAIFGLIREFRRQKTLGCFQPSRHFEPPILNQQIETSGDTEGDLVDFLLLDGENESIMSLPELSIPTEAMIPISIRASVGMDIPDRDNIDSFYHGTWFYNGRRYLDSEQNELNRSTQRQHSDDDCDDVSLMTEFLRLFEEPDVESNPTQHTMKAENSDACATTTITTTISKNKDMRTFAHHPPQAAPPAPIQPRNKVTSELDERKPPSVVPTVRTPQPKSTRKDLPTYVKGNRKRTHCSICGQQKVETKNGIGGRVIKIPHQCPATIEYGGSIRVQHFHKGTQTSESDWAP